MLPITDSFEFDYFGSEMIYGQDCIDWLGELLARKNLDDALVVCGSNVGANEAVMRPIRQGLDNRLGGVFDGTTPEKSAETIYDGIEAMRETNADVLIGVGGGSSLDIARQMSVFEADGRSLADFRTAALEGRSMSRDVAGSHTPVIVVPTTFAGADVSSGGSIEILSAEKSPTDQPVRLSGSVMPDAMVYDPNLFETTPMSVLAGSAMNGFDKGIETIYARNATPITDATAVRGLRLLRAAYPNLGGDPTAMKRAVIGLVLVQFERRISLIHAFGHGFARHYPVQQGVIHAILVPHVLRYLFEQIDGNRKTLADGLGVDDSQFTHDELSEEIVREVTRVRDSFDLPIRLREINAINEGELPTVAELILSDGLMSNTPEEFDPSAEEIEAVLYKAW
jgi:alcohol dehydrogenase class IV